MVYKFKIKNLGNCQRKLVASPQLVPYLNCAVIAPWDKYEWYLDTESLSDKYIKFRTSLLSADADVKKRRCAFYASDIDNFKAYELSLEKYIGYGDIGEILSNNLD